MDVTVLGGSSVLDELGAALDDLHAAVGAPLTSRRRWLQVWAECYADYTPTVVVVKGPDGRLEAVAPLAVRRRGGINQIVAMGHGPSDAMTLPARDHASADRLTAEIGRLLQDHFGTWTLTLRHLVPDDLVVRRLEHHLQHVRFLQGDVLPVLRSDGNQTLRPYVSRNHHQQVQRLRNRMRKEGHEPVVEHLDRAADIQAVMPELERVLRARDADVGRRSVLDDPSGRSFLRRVIDVHAGAGEVRLTTLRLDGELAAYVLCFDDHGVYRMWNCRYDPPWSRFGVGKVAMDESVQNALSAGASAYDFMRGEEQYKASYANESVGALDLFAWSGQLLATRGQALLAARERVARLEAAGGRSARAAEVARRVAARGRA